MSHFISSLAVGLSLAAACAGAAFSPFGPRRQEADAVDSTAPRAASPAPASSPTAGASGSVFLLKDGGVRRHEGAVSEEGSDYVFEHPAGAIRLPKARVAGRFDSLDEVYQYRRDRLPEGDPDEHMKLALWCLSHDLKERAAEQLRAVLSWSPNDHRASAMLTNLESSMRRAERPPLRDEGVARASAEGSEPRSSPRGAEPAEPRELERSVLARIRAYGGPVGVPEVFDLPEPAAVRRFQEFGRVVHPILQARCASCHDEESHRSFQLVRARKREDLRNELLVRTNMEAALGLVDRYRPAHSPLLINAALPHGPDRVSILGDPNGPEYRALWTWIDSLKVEETDVWQRRSAPEPNARGGPDGRSARRADFADGGGERYGGGFGSRRAAAVPPGRQPARRPVQRRASPHEPPDFTPSPGSSYQAIQGGSHQHPSVPDETRFAPVSPLMATPEAQALANPNRDADARRTATPMAPEPTTRPAAPVPGQAPAARPSADRGGFGGAGDFSRTVPGAPVQGSRAGRPNASRREVGADGPSERLLSDGSRLITRPDGSQVLQLPDGTIAPILDKSAVSREAKAKAKRGDKAEEREIKIDPALYQKLQRRRLRGGAPR